jgi:hypothetical protein
VECCKGNSSLPWLQVVKENKIVLFMKGNKDFPQCGFSNTVVQVLTACKADFEAINVLESMESSWVVVTLSWTCSRVVSCKRWWSVSMPRREEGIGCCNLHKAMGQAERNV